MTKKTLQQHAEDGSRIPGILIDTRKRLRDNSLPPWTTGGRGVRRTGVHSAEALYPAVVGTRENTTCTLHASRGVAEVALFLSLFLGSPTNTQTSLSQKSTALVLDESSCACAWTMPQSQLQGERQGSHGRHHHNPIVVMPETRVGG